MICGSFLSWNKWNRTRICPEETSHRYNNVRSNGDIANGLINFVIVFGFFACFLSFAFIDWKDDIIVPTFLTYVISFLFSYVLLPLKMIVSKPEIRLHFKECINNVTK